MSDATELAKVVVDNSGNPLGTAAELRGMLDTLAQAVLDLSDKVDRLTSRGIEDMRATIADYKAALERIRDAPHNQVCKGWWGGDCNCHVAIARTALEETTHE